MLVGQTDATYSMHYNTGIYTTVNERCSLYDVKTNI